MMTRLVVRLVAAALAGGLACSAAAQSNGKRALAEQTLMRAVLERGAFLACARLDTGKQTAEMLIRGWQIDLTDSETALRVIGYSDDEIAALRSRFDIEKAAPKFADLASLGAYCSVLGDWRTRWQRLLVILPQIELRRLVNP